MTPGQAHRAIERGRRVKHVESGGIFEMRDGKMFWDGRSAVTFPCVGTFKPLKPKADVWKAGEVRWQKDGLGVVYRYTSEKDARYFTASSAPIAVGCNGWSDKHAGITDITPAEGLRLIHAMGWNEDGTRREDLETLRREVGSEPRVGDAVTYSPDRVHVVEAVTPNLVAYTWGAGQVTACLRSEWANWCKTATKIERAKQ